MTGYTNQPSVLIVDDENSCIMTLVHILGSEYTLHAAKNGDDALKLAKKHKPDLILLDILMPDIDGFEVLARLKKDAETADIPVIFVTGYEGIDIATDGNEGEVKFIKKPYDISTVKTKVDNVIRLRAKKG